MRRYIVRSYEADVEMDDTVGGRNVEEDDSEKEDVTSDDCTPIAFVLYFTHSGISIEF